MRNPTRQRRRARQSEAGFEGRFRKQDCTRSRKYHVLINPEAPQDSRTTSLQPYSSSGCTRGCKVLLVTNSIPNRLLDTLTIQPAICTSPRQVRAGQSKSYSLPQASQNTTSERCGVLGCVPPRIRHLQGFVHLPRFIVDGPLCNDDSSTRLPQPTGRRHKMDARQRRVENASQGVGRDGRKTWES